MSIIDRVLWMAFFRVYTVNQHFSDMLNNVTKCNLLRFGLLFKKIEYI